MTSTRRDRWNWATYCSAICAVVLLAIPVRAIAEAVKLFLWRAQAEYGHPTYLFGSLHYATQACYPLQGEIEATYMGATAVAVEVDLTKPEVAEVAEWLGRYRRGGHLEREVPQPLLSDLEQFAKRHGWDWKSVSANRPWVVASMISAADFQTMGYQRELGTDLYFSRAAQRDRKRIVELESVRQQYDLFNRLPLETQLFLLQDSMDAVKSGDNSMTLHQMIDAWRVGDAETFAALVEASLANAADPVDLAGKIYGQRNRRMAERIDALVQTGERLFVVVGAAHLAGPDSLLEVLRAKGFRVEQVSVPSPMEAVEQPPGI
jgi:uncharacterized protein YbaP (TraB family)